MKERYVFAGLLMIALAVSVIAADFGDGSVSCNRNNPFGIYLCDDGKYFMSYDSMIAYYVPPLEQTTPDYTFVTGGQTEGFSGQ